MAPRRTIDRRTFLRRAGVGAAAVTAVGGLTGRAVLAAPPPGKGGGKDKGEPTPTSGNLYLPKVVGGVVGLTASRVTGNTREDQPSSYLGYTWEPTILGSMPGPTIEVATGETLTATFENGLDGDSTIHWHGMLVRTGQDGQPQEAVPAGRTRTYELPPQPRATMNWYHPHPHGHTAEQVALGLAGAVIVRDGLEADLDLPTGRYEVPLIIRDADIDRDGTLIYKPRSSGYLGKLPLVNGTRDAVLAVEPAVYRFRVLNGANGRVMQLMLDAGLPMTLIGVDGGLLPNARTLTTIDLSMAERLDVLVDFRGRAGEALALRDTMSGWTLLTFLVGGTTSQTGVTMHGDGDALTSDLGSHPLWNTPIPGAPDETFSFDGMGRIDGQSFEMQRVDAHIPWRTTQRWRFTTGGNGPHPVHIHGDYFRVLGGSGGRRDGVSTDGVAGLFPWELGLKDTVLLQDGETVDVAVNFTKGPEGPDDGFYLMHCHKLEHEDAGMMLNIDVHTGTERAVRPMGIA